jgi:hypothetical protein
MRRDISMLLGIHGGCRGFAEMQNLPLLFLQN